MVALLEMNARSSSTTGGGYSASETGSKTTRTPSWLSRTVFWVAMMRLGFSAAVSELLSRTCTWMLAEPGARAVLNQIWARTWSLSVKARPGKKIKSSGYTKGCVVVAVILSISDTVVVVAAAARRSRVSAATSMMRSTHSWNMWQYPVSDNTRARHSG